ncbi:MAG: helix-turn-helix domain-containing protein [Bacteroidota bacterium]
MRSLSELFEYLSNSTKETILTELTDHCDRLVQKNGKKAITPFKFEVENMNTLFRLSEWYLSIELPKMIEEKYPNKGGDEVMTVEEVANYTKLTPAMIYKLIKQGKLKKIGISGVDKPGARESKRVWKSEVDRYLGK